MVRIMEIIKKLKTKGYKHIIHSTIPWLLFVKFEKPLSYLVKKIYLRRPIEDIIIIESHNDFDSNGGAFYNYLLDNGYNKRHKIVWFLRNKAPKNLPKNVYGYRYNRLSVKRVYFHCVAKIILCEHYVIPAIRKEQVSVYMRHGAGGLKKVTNYFTLPSNVKYILGLSKTYAPIENLEEFLTDKQQEIVYLGFPSHDYLFKDNRSEIKKITTNSYKKKILWMPTFRKTVDNRNDSSMDFPLGISLFENIEEYISLNDYLYENDCLLVIKIHPMQDLSYLKIMDMSNIRVINGMDVKKLHIDNYKLMSCCDAMISDYSGAAYDYIQLNRPIAYVLSDMNEYKLGFVVEDIHKLIAGKEIYTLKDMFEFINDVVNDKDSFKQKRQDLRDFIYTYHDSNNSKRLAEFLGLKI